MRKSFAVLALIFAVILCAGVCQAQKQNPDPGKDPEAATFNLSYPMISTTVIDVLYQKALIINDEGEEEWVVFDVDSDGELDPIAVDENFDDEYGGLYEGYEGEFYNEYDPASFVDGCPTDTDGDGLLDMLYLDDEYPMVTWLGDNEPWYDQPTAITGEDDCLTNPNRIWDPLCVEPANT